ncbi:MAG: DUF4058 family protein [Pirellulales bacterium]
MPSPFPGMNPYLEQVDVWHDFHQSFVAHIRDAIAPQIRPKYLAKIDENVYIHELSAEERHLLGRPDVAVLSNQPGGTTTAVAERAAPAYGHLLPLADELQESFIEIRDQESRELITVIELRSPTNKVRGPDRDQYIAKRRCILASPAHLVEIDLLRGHERMPVRDMPPCDYVVMVSRYQERPRVGLWPINLRDRLPEIPIPLRYDDPDATLDLQPVLANLYDAAGYEDYIYRGKPQPPLRGEDAVWAEGMIEVRRI